MMRLKNTLLALGLAASLSACVPVLLVGGVAVGAMVGSDPRKSEVIKTDFDLGAKISSDLIDAWKEKAHINVSTFNGVVLLTGEVPDEAAKVRAFEIAQRQSRARKIYNETVVSVPSTAANRLYDTQLTARVKTALLAGASDTDAVHLQVVTERSVVYLMGVSRPDISESAARAASRVSGVRQVVKLVEPLTGY
ncbi:BON domain-containing protein [Iodobacter ciconiae]|uniref:BON domain-containing protein n=1 Tax=Iodobacter ciconiae TaxID=2496266 RepID=A0A3S8ZWF3_9NEIS|nr:BON domain-containing protein [Iodobacter ciconiae]AZN37755.1 BON domain-containing protein [Iodobacter ciconiae]